MSSRTILAATATVLFLLALGTGFLLDHHFQSLEDRHEETRVQLQLLRDLRAGRGEAVSVGLRGLPEPQSLEPELSLFTQALTIRSEFPEPEASALARCGHGLRFREDTLERIQAHDWPGNVRELRNVIERMAALADAECLTPMDLPPGIGTTPSPIGNSLADAEQRHILGVLEEVGGNKTRAAKVLGISPTTLYAKLKRYEGGTDED